MFEAAEEEEVSYMNELGACNVVKEGEVEKKTGQAPTTVKWVRVNKGTTDELVIRARLLARDCKTKNDDRRHLFESLPPLDAKKMLFRCWCGYGARGGEGSCYSSTLRRRT